ncbi:MAG: ABC transporter substrate-binding protein [Micromonosporaceae bacterium]|nr:ABC transporter substrate-binding protein [Micromonosporaceae bacterium]
MIRPRTAALAVLTAAALVAGGCGTTEDPDPEPTGPAATGGPVTVTDSRGEPVSLPAPAQRVVGLEWGEVEMLVSLGVMPVGVADMDGYRTWVSAAPLDPGVTDVGLRGEPSVDAIVSLSPDLVVMEAERGSALVTQLEEYVPVLVAEGSDAGGNLERMREDLRMIATAVGRTEQAENLLSELDTGLATDRDQIAAAGGTGQRFAMADGWRQGSAISIRMFGTGSLVSEVAGELGLANAWTGEVDEVWGLGNTDPEGLKEVLSDEDDLRFFYNASDGDDVFADGLAGNPLWDRLPFVAQEQVNKLPDGIWTFGGPLSCRQFADAMVAAYAG